MKKQILVTYATKYGATAGIAKTLQGEGFSS